MVFNGYKLIFYFNWSSGSYKTEFENLSKTLYTFFEVELAYCPKTSSVLYE